MSCPAVIALVAVALVIKLTSEIHHPFVVPTFETTKEMQRQHPDAELKRKIYVERRQIDRTLFV